MKKIERFHHISAIVGNEQENYDFYTKVLGLKLIKQTLNFDDPNVYHLYFSDNGENPDFVLTFFPWNRSYKGRKGAGQFGRIAFRVPKGKLDEWGHFLFAKGFDSTWGELFGKKALLFEDPHSLELALVESDVESETRAILGFHGIVALTADPELSKAYFRDTIGLEEIAENTYRTHGSQAHEVYVDPKPKGRGLWGAGTVHHLALAVEDQEELVEWQEYIYDSGIKMSEVKDRFYFGAIYSQDKNGLVVEFSTKGPGFTTDETLEELGKELQIPPKYQDRELELRNGVTPLKL